MRRLIVGLAVVVLAVVLVGVRQVEGVIPYPPTLVAEHTAQLRASPYVMRTVSGDADLVVGESLGWDDPPIPQHDLYGYKITNPFASGPKLNVVMISGNHNTEHSGSWTLQGAIDFLVGNDSRASFLRAHAEFYVYPMVNPDGRFTGTGRGNPELYAQGFSDHNRAWHTTGFSTIDALTGVMIADTGGEAEYFFDFHSTFTSNFFYETAPEFVDSDYSRAMTAREPTIGPVLWTVEQPGYSIIWAMSEAGLNATYAFIPENDRSPPESRHMEIGQNYMLALYDVIVPEPSTLVLLTMAALTLTIGWWSRRR